MRTSEALPPHLLEPENYWNPKSEVLLNKKENKEIKYDNVKNKRWR